jgi:DNA-binding response OmpR family regulator
MAPLGGAGHMLRCVNGAGLHPGEKAEMSVARDPVCPLIAIVEDDHAVLNSLEFSLEAEGYDVCAFEDARDALASARIGSADCLVIDYGLPDGDGVTLLQGLRQKGVDCPAIIIASNPSARCRRDAQAAGAPVIEKPLMDDALSALIRNVLPA